MDKYLVKPTQIIGDNGLNYNIKDEKVKTNIPLEAIIYDCF